MGTSSGMIKQARRLLGLTERPPGSNHNKITRWYGFDGPWCNMSISFIAAHSDNLAAVMGKFAWTVAHARAFRRQGRWHFGLGGVRPGDVVFFDWSGSRIIENIDHVGLVEAVHSNGTITTLEGNTSDAFRRRRRNRTCVVGYGRPAYDDARPMPKGDGMLRRGSTGSAVKVLQRGLNRVSGTNLVVDGEFGPATEAALKAFQASVHITVDGEYGPQSAAMLKAALAGRDAPIKPKPTPPGQGQLVVDGEFGPVTCAALQRALNARGANLAVDGSFGPATRKALQRHLHVAQDGKIGPKTIKVLQRHVGVAEDGSWGSVTNKAIQRALNSGRF